MMLRRFILGLLLGLTATISVNAGFILYDHGNPTDYEQLVLELLNRARANPSAEAARYGIDLNADLAPGTIQNTPKQPLTFESHLIQAAREHSQWMLDTGIFSHTGANGSTSHQRMAAAGYPFSGSYTSGENISWMGTAAPSFNKTEYILGHHEGLFKSAGHRQNICNNNYKNLGVGVKYGSFQGYQASMLTENFAASSVVPSPQLTGVVYYDFNSNSFYDPDEGVRGVHVDVPGSNFYAITSASGGYAVPVSGVTGIQSVSFESDGITTSTPASFDGISNKKADLVMTYLAPEIAGDARPPSDYESQYTLPFVFGATSLDIVLGILSLPASDNADNLDRVNVSISDGYTPLSSVTKHSGAYAYHLATSVAGTDQTLTYKTKFYVKDNAFLSFWSRLLVATPDQKATVQVSKDNGYSWDTLYSQSGTDHDTEPTFILRTVSLAAYSNNNIILRFNYSHTSGYYYPQTTDNVGWFIDDITFDNIDEVDESIISNNANGGIFSFTPASGESYTLQVIPRHYERTWPAGTIKQISSAQILSYAGWAHIQETSNGLPASSISNNPDGDLNNDGISNFLAYALGLSPITPSSHLLPKPSQSGQFLYFDYWLDSTKTDVEITPQVSIDVTTWSSPALSPIAFAIQDTHIEFEGTTEFRRLIIDCSLVSKVFIRLKATQK